ncbi:uncharacterized protein LOC126907172 [Daktulosphaira vitifoliae]|uniref:uncharacterized protein LOC126907172 n=1 Tax=Daktulosphaira vitifoliae TaxID=58002 RepID=UPI0021AAE9E4|nr:uncharacterized protein LOC126907172 [Daktulosphaira vitifoliae]
MDSSYLNVLEKYTDETPIEDLQYRSYLPFSTTALSNGDQIRIAVQNTDSYTLLCDSFIYIEGEVKISGSSGEIAIANNGLAFLFDSISYEMNGIEIQKVKDPGITSLLKGYCSYSLNDVNNLQNAYWDANTTPNDYSKTNFTFSGCIPLSHIFGFCEDYRKILIQVNHQLVMNRALNDRAALRAKLTEGVTWASEEAKELLKSSIVLTKVVLKLPVARVNDREKLKLLKIVETRKNIYCAFRNWDLYVYPELPNVEKTSWMVKTSSNIDRPRYLIIAFNTRKSTDSGDRTQQLDSCSLVNLKVHLNSSEYPYENFNENFDKKLITLFYQNYVNFQQTYYERRKSKPLFNKEEFLKYGPVFCIDCTRQKDDVKTSTIDLRIDFESSSKFPENTTAYC